MVLESIAGIAALTAEVGSAALGAAGAVESAVIGTAAAVGGAIAPALPLAVGPGLSLLAAREGPKLPRPRAGPTRTVSDEATKARLDMQERLKRKKAGRAKSNLTLPDLFGKAETQTPILADVLG